MSKPTTKVDKLFLQNAIERAEVNGPLANRNDLYAEVARLYNIEAGFRSDLPLISASVVYLRIRDWNLSLLTPKGRRGRVKGQRIEGAGKRKPKAERFAKDSAIQASFARLEKITPQRFMPLVEQVKKGSRGAAVKLHCLECSGYVTKEVADCVCTSCPLYAFRPYQTKK